MVVQILKVHRRTQDSFLAVECGSSKKVDTQGETSLYNNLEFPIELPDISIHGYTYIYIYMYRSLFSKRYLYVFIYIYK